MLVYADRRSDLSAGEMLRTLKRRLKRNSAMTLSELRVPLVLAGQIEQGALDADAEWTGDAHHLTALCARSFVDVSLSTKGSATGLSEIQAAAEQLEVAIDAAPTPCSIRIPEGFAWYAVYPDAYIGAALEWASARPRRQRVLAIGLRSIGTTLAAVVAATLRRRGCEVRVMTVRPHGHPFARVVQIPPIARQPDAAIVIDEGPGLSGSSMAAVADALERRGVPARAISFFAAHRNGPGQQASMDVRRRWQSTATYTTELSALRMGRETLVDAMASFHGATDVVGVGSGGWLSMAGLAGTLPPAFAPRIEIPKLLARGASGSTLWKFAGFTLIPSPGEGPIMTSAEAVETRLGSLGERGLTPKPNGSKEGWIAVPWIEGRRLTPQDGSPRVLGQVAAYIAESCNPPLTRDADASARRRLADILCRNSECLLGPRGCEAARPIGRMLARELHQTNMPAYGDGRMAPHEWIQTADGRILKTDAAGHDFDHTVVGPQSILWDVAGMMVEWRLDHHQAAEVLACVKLSGCFETALACYRAAYAAFRAGVASLCGAESNRDQAVAFYRGRLERELAVIGENTR